MKDNSFSRLSRFCYYLLCVSFILHTASCGVFKKRVVDESFEDFYIRFNNDMAFQNSRIDFPIQGYNEDIYGRHPWSPENWVEHRAEISSVDDTRYETTSRLDSARYYEEIKALDGSLYFSRTFVKLRGQWFLSECINIEL